MSRVLPGPALLRCSTRRGSISGASPMPMATTLTFKQILFLPGGGLRADLTGPCDSLEVLFLQLQDLDKVAPNPKAQSGEGGRWGSEVWQRSPKPPLRLTHRSAGPLQPSSPINPLLCHLGFSSYRGIIALESRVMSGWGTEREVGPCPHRGWLPGLQKELRATGPPALRALAHSLSTP